MFFLFNIGASVGCNLKHFTVSNATNSTNIDFYQQSNDDGKKIYNKKRKPQIFEK